MSGIMWMLFAKPGGSLSPPNIWVFWFYVINDKNLFVKYVMPRNLG